MCSVDVAAFGPALAPLDGLVESFDQLARQDPLDLPSSVLGEQIAGLFLLRSRMDAEITRRVAVFDRTQGFAAFDSHSTGGGRPATWCEGHHLVHWIDGGETSVENGALVCGRCHRRLHEGGHRLVRKPDRTWTAIRDPLPLSRISDMGAAGSVPRPAPRRARRGAGTGARIHTQRMPCRSDVT